MSAHDGGVCLDGRQTPVLVHNGHAERDEPPIPSGAINCLLACDGSGDAPNAAGTAGPREVTSEASSLRVQSGLKPIASRTVGLLRCFVNEIGAAVLFSLL